ncbi:MAG: UDP-N-acetylmuramate--L-alanine ligase [Endomicrobiia bacterium]|nr:UDP-N-acetylmuramate--L-alanine ligase [Endomicrobiia bacterium]
MFDHIKKIHFVGIGGSGMSGIAEVLINLGYHVSGSDLKKSDATVRLAKLGAKISEGHAARNIRQADVVVTSTAVEAKNPEVVEARRRKIPVIPRIEMLSEIARLKYTVAVAGTHGKTTTTSLAALILTEGGLDPTVVIGGRLKNISSGARLGKGKYLVAEADESDGSFLKLSPAVSIVTNIDDDHLDYYGALGNLKKSFAEFINKVPFYGCSILCADDKNLRDVIPSVNRRYVTYGFSRDNDYVVSDYSTDGRISGFRLANGSKNIGKITWGVPGRHNALNAAAAAICGLELGVPFSKIKKALASFGGVARRMETKYSGGGIEIIDDYGHHPTEIKATLNAVKERFRPKRLIVIFQPHRYSRTKLLYKELAEALRAADNIMLMEIYPAQERPVAGITSHLIKNEIEAAGGRVEYFRADDAAALAAKLKDGDVVVTLGAGDVTQLGARLAEALDG